MSTIKSSTEHLTLNADGAGKDIKFQANGVEKASIDSSGNFTSTSIDATKLSGTVPNFTSTGIDDNATSNVITIASNKRVNLEADSNKFGLLFKYDASTNGCYLGAPSVDAFTISSSGGAERMRIDSSGKLIVNGGMIQLNGNELGGAQVYIADDTVATINAPRYGGYMFITVGGEGLYPTAIGNLFYYDCGPSTHIYESSGFSITSGSSIDASTATLTGTTGTNGRITVSPTSSKTIQIENRQGVNRYVQVTFL